MTLPHEADDLWRRELESHAAWAARVAPDLPASLRTPDDFEREVYPHVGIKHDLKRALAWVGGVEREWALLPHAPERRLPHSAVVDLRRYLRCAVGAEDAIDALVPGVVAEAREARRAMPPDPLGRCRLDGACLVFDAGRPEDRDEVRAVVVGLRRLVEAWAGVHARMVALMEARERLPAAPATPVRVVEEPRVLAAAELAELVKGGADRVGKLRITAAELAHVLGVSKQSLDGRPGLPAPAGTGARRARFWLVTPELFEHLRCAWDVDEDVRERLSVLLRDRQPPTTADKIDNRP